MISLPRLLQPRSLSGRVFAMFGLAMLVFLVFGLGMFYRYQFVQHLVDTQNAAATLADVTAQAISHDAAAESDRDLIRRSLSSALNHSPLKSAVFTGQQGAQVVVTPPLRRDAAPRWLASAIASRVTAATRDVAVDGRSVGVVRFEIDEDGIAAELWKIMLQTGALVAGFALLSYVLMRSMLHRWLANLKRLSAYEHKVASGEITAEAQLLADAPSEIQDAIQAVNRSAASMRNQYGQRIELLMHSLVQHKRAMDQIASVCEVDTRGRIINANEQFTRNWRIDPAVLVGTELSAIGRPAASRAPWKPAPAVWNGEVALDGATMQCERTVVPIYGAGQAIEKYICIDIDITARKQFEHAIMDNAQRQTLVAALGHKALHSNSLEELFGHAGAAAARGLNSPYAAVLEADSNRNAAIVRAVFGWTEDLVGSEFEGRVTGAAPASGLLPWSVALRAAKGIAGGLDVAIFRGARLFGTLGVYETAARTFSAVEVDFLKSIAAIVATALQRDDARSRVTFLDQYDPLTNLPNRRRLTRFLDESILRARGRSDSCAFLIIDLDRFKDINDTLGHSAGDQLLELAARRLLDCVRAGDVVGRLGGDEFAVVLPAAAPRRESGAVAAAIVDALARPFTVQGHQVYATASVGIAAWPGDGDSADALVRSADTAMYSAKNNGRSTYAFYAAEMNESATRRLRVEAELREALRRREFEMHYQAKVSLATGKLAGFEALLRWRHPERGLVPPLEFIGLLEDTGLIIPVGEWIIETVCGQLALWQAAGLDVVPVAVNLSARQFQQADLASVIARIVASAGVDAHLLEFELTESLLMADPEAAAATLAAIKEQGMRLSVDDFGTGYSSLAYLKRFPLDTLKIDRAFVRELPYDGDDAAITQAVVSLAHHLSLKVVAEGVETVEQARALHGYGCDQIQGYFASKPLPAAQCAALLAKGQLLDRAAIASEPIHLVELDNTPRLATA
jgi:diguanylate cyclase (GGDEF)-like protein